MFQILTLRVSKRVGWALAIALGASLSVPFAESQTDSQRQAADPGVRPGDPGAGQPLPGLTAGQLGMFNQGKDAFEEVNFVVNPPPGGDAGLGPRAHSGDWRPSRLDSILSRVSVAIVNRSLAERAPPSIRCSKSQQGSEAATKYRGFSRRTDLRGKSGSSRIRMVPLMGVYIICLSSAVARMRGDATYVRRTSATRRIWYSGFRLRPLAAV